MSIISKKFSIRQKQRTRGTISRSLQCLQQELYWLRPWRALRPIGARFPWSLIASRHSVLDNFILDSIHELAGWYYWNRITPLPCTCNWHQLLYSSSLCVPMMDDSFLLNRETEFSRTNSFIYFCCCSWMLQILFTYTFASGSEVRVFDPGWDRWIFSESKNLEYDFLRKGSTAVGPSP